VSTMKYFEKKITSKNEKVETNLESYRSEVTQFKTEIVKEIKAGNEDTKEIKEGMIPPTCNTSALINSGNQPGSVQGRQKEQGEDSSTIVTMTQNRCRFKRRVYC